MTLVAAIDRLFEAHLIVADLDASIALYRDRLGLELAHVMPARQAVHIAFAAAADDVIAAPGRLQSAGIDALDFTGQPTDEPVVLAWMPAMAVYFLDPDGHLLEYIAMLEGEPRLDDGVVTWRAWTLAGDPLKAQVVSEAYPRRSFGGITEGIPRRAGSSRTD